MAAETERSLLARLWIYQAERLPLGKTGLLTLAFSSSSVTASAALAGRPPPGPLAYVAAFLIAFTTMLVLRVLDEFKDADLDRRHRPERPVPRGLVTLGTLAAVGIGASVLAAGVALWLDPAMIGLLGLLAAFLAAMTVHFGLPALLNRSLLLTLLSHMLVMPLMDLAVTACEWLPQGSGPPPGLSIFLALSFANGCVLEIGRKTWAPGNERAHVESYSSAWGIRPAMLAWFAFLVSAVALVSALGHVQGSAVVGPLAGAAFAWVAAEGALFLRNPTPRRQARLDAASGLWILASYLVAGYGAFLSHRIIP